MKRFIAVFISLVLCFTISMPCFANQFITSRGMILGDAKFHKGCSATFRNSSKGGSMLLSVSSSPEATDMLIDKLSGVCSVFGWIPGCDYVDYGERFYRYVERGMRVKVRLRDLADDSIIWEGTLKDGDMIYLGPDHPNGYIVEFKSSSAAPTFISLQEYDNLILR